MKITRIEFIDMVFAARESLTDRFFKRREEYQTTWRKFIWFFTGKPDLYDLSMRVVDWEEEKLNDALHWHMQRRLEQTAGQLDIDITNDLTQYPILKDFY